MLTGWIDDARQSARWIGHHLALSAVVVGTLGAAASGAIAAFAIAEAAIFNPLPDSNPGTLVGAWTTGPARPQTVDVSSWPDFVDLRRGASTFSTLSAYAVDSARFTGNGDPRELDIARVGEAFEALLPAPMALGRPFNASDFAPDPPRTAILQHGFWLREFGGDPAIVGRTIVLNEAPVEIVGVLPRSRLQLPLERNDVWIPLVPSPKVFWQVARGTGWLKVVGRLRPERLPDEAQAELSAIAARLASMYPDSNREKTTARVRTLADEVAGPIAPVLALLAVGLGAVVVIACGNIANLLLSSASRRRREFAVRQAIGASSGRLTRQLFLETLTLCTAASLAGIGASMPLARTFLAMYPSVVSNVDLSITPAIVAAALGLAVLLAVVLTAIAMVSAASSRVSLNLHTGGRSTAADGIVRHALVSVQVALSVMLVIGGVALVRTVWRLAAVDPGFQPRAVLTFRVMPSGARFGSSADTVAAYERMLSGIAQLPGVRAAAAATAMPLTTSGWMFGVRPRGAATDVRVMVNLASARYFETLGVPVRAGRVFSAPEALSEEAIAVVNEPLARILAPDGSVVGATFPYSGRTWRVIGIVGGTRGRQIRQPPGPELFLPWGMAGRRPQAIAVRADGDAMALLPAIARQVHEVDPSAPLADVATLESRLADAIRAETFRATLLAALAGLALALAAVGAYSVTSFAVSCRTREYGIRLALGEWRGSVLWRAARSAAVPALYGTLLGLVAAVAAGRWLARFLYETRATELDVLAGAAVVIMAPAMIGALAAARDAAQTDPATALRVDD